MVKCCNVSIKKFKEKCVQCLSALYYYIIINFTDCKEEVEGRNMVNNTLKQST